MALIELSGVSKSYQRGSHSVEVFRSLDFEVATGDFIAVMGPSGSGKSTLLNLIAGLDSPTEGQITFDGSRIDRLTGKYLARWRARHVGFIFQSYHLLPVLTAARNVEVPLLLTTLLAAERRQRAAFALSLVGLTERADHKPDQLSGGEQQRVAIARAIVSDPMVLICDEPTGDLDRKSADEVLQLLQALNQRQGKTLIMVTHDPIAAQFARSRVIVDKGAVVNPRVGLAV